MVQAPVSYCMVSLCCLTDSIAAQGLLNTEQIHYACGGFLTPVRTGTERPLAPKSKRPATLGKSARQWTSE